jgi:hypothetical protein
MTSLTPSIATMRRLWIGLAVTLVDHQAQWLSGAKIAQSRG